MSQGRGVCFNEVIGDLLARRSVPKISRRRCRYEWTTTISEERKSVFECENCGHKTSGPPKGRICRPTTPVE